MSNETLQSKIDLIEDKIENIKHSGFFTDAEIERELKALQNELDSLQNLLDSNTINNIEVTSTIIK